MKLKYNALHKSIANFPEVELPGFTVLVGPNGAGKSQLLEAIELGHINCFDETNAEIPRNQIRRFNWQNFLPSNEQDVHQNQFDQQQNQVWQILNQAQQQIKSQLIAAKRENPDAKNLSSTVDILAMSDINDLKNEVGDLDVAKTLHLWLSENITKLHRATSSSSRASTTRNTASCYGHRGSP